ncbi:MAG: HIT family protein [Vicinamibacterales bacterium]
MSDDYYCEFILSGQVPVDVVVETDRVLAFHHVFQTWDTHFVIIPKEHVRSLSEVDDPSLLAELFQVAIRIIRERRLSETNYKVITNGGSYQSNRHLHIHLVSGKPLDANNFYAKGEMAV